MSGDVSPIIFGNEEWLSGKKSNSPGIDQHRHQMIGGVRNACRQIRLPVSNRLRGCASGAESNSKKHKKRKIKNSF
jgi:hypothetical protein